MYMHGIGTARSCEAAIEQFKIVAERGPWVQQLRTSLSQFRSKDYHAAFVTNLMFAERGYEIAQENAACDVTRLVDQEKYSWRKL